MKTYGDWFSGFGGMTIGAKEAGFKPVFACEYDAEIASVYAKNLGDHVTVADLLTLDNGISHPRFPRTKNIRKRRQQDAQGDWFRRVLARGAKHNEFEFATPHFPRVDWKHDSPPCFPKGVHILTKRGLVDISEVVVGDMVVTHKGRWRKVTSVMSRGVESLVELKGLGHWGLLSTKDHPFLSVTRTRKWNNEKRGWDSLDSETSWVSAEDMKDKHWLSLCKYPELPIPAISSFARDDSRSQKFNHSNSFFWVIGAWLGDGWLRLDDDPRKGRRRGTVNISCGKHKAEVIKNKLLECGIKFSVSEQRTAIRFSIYSRALAGWLFANFGKGASEKTIPAWALGMKEAWRKSLYQGYVFTDGYDSNKTYEASRATTVSKNLAIGLRMIGLTLGYSVTLGKYSRDRNCVIEGREVNELPTHTISFANSERHSRYVNDLYRTGLVREVKRIDSFETVYDITVEGDESFIADGIVVHNCPNFSIAKAGAQEGLREIALAVKCCEYLIYAQPSFYSLENVYGYRKSESFKLILGTLHSLGYGVSYWHLNAADYGVPQTRKRLILMARADGRKPQKPTATRQKEAQINSGFVGSLFGDSFELPQWIGWHEAIEDLAHSLPDSEFADWQKERLPKELSEFFTDCTNACRSYTQREKGQPATTITTEMFRRPSTAPKAFLLGQGSHSQPDAHAPADTVTGNTNQTGVKALLVNGTQNDNGRTVTNLPANEPAFTMTASGYKRPLRTLLISGANASTARPLADTEPVCTVGDVNRSGNVPRAFLAPIQGEATNGFGVDEPAQTIAANHGAAKYRAAINGRVVQMTVRALARFQSFPDWYRFPKTNEATQKRMWEGYRVWGKQPLVLNKWQREHVETSRSLSCKGIGNAVPPKLAAAIGKNWGA